MGINDWTDNEVNLIVADYFYMLNDELKGLSVNKSNHRRLLMPFLNNRSAASLEYKHRNISAVLAEMGLPFIKGYKPLPNFQRSKLVPVVQRFIKSKSYLENSFNEFSLNDSGVIGYTKFDNILEDPPTKALTVKEQPRARSPFKINYLEKEQNNRSLGLKGEEFAFNYERCQLINAGKESLANKIEWVSKEQGDGLGFDILSKNLNGTDKYIEVKTTKLIKESPFYFSINEYQFSIENERDFHLYRLFDFEKNPKMFILSGRYDKFCQIEPIQFSGNF